MSEYDRPRKLGSELTESVEFTIGMAVLIVCLRRKSPRRRLTILREVSELLAAEASVISISRSRAAVETCELAAERWKRTVPALVAALGREEGT